MFLIPESLLENLTCDNCKKYLSVSPVKVYPNKNILCGRCSKENDGGVVSLYENIVQRGLFKCVNRYDGCNEILSYSEVPSHEENCKSELYSCPNCDLEPKMPSFLLVNHFKECHKETILRYPNISMYVDRLNVDYKKYLYIKENVLFLICLSLNSNHMGLNTFYIRKSDFSREITQRYTLSSPDGALKNYITEKFPCCMYEDDNNSFPDRYIIDFEGRELTLNIEVDLDTRKAEQLILLPISCTSRIDKTTPPIEPIDVCNNKLYLSEEFKKMWYPQYTLDCSQNSLVNVNNKLLKCCCFCQNKFNYFSINQSIYKCSQCSSDFDNYICSKCYFFGIKTCNNGKDYEFAPQETTVFKCIKYFCKWNCNETHFGWDLQEHESNCAFQTDLSCPVEYCKWIGRLSAIPEHMQRHMGTIFHEGHSFPLDFIVIRQNFSKMVITVLNQFVILRWKKLNGKYIFTMHMKESNNKVPLAIVNVNGNIDIFTDMFVLNPKNHPVLLIILRDI